MSFLTLGIPPALLLLLLLLLSHAAAGLGGGDAAEQWSAVTRPSPLFPVNHRHDVTLETASSSDINALAVPNESNTSNIQRFASLPDRPSKNGSDKRRFRPGSVTSLGPIPIENEDVHPLAIPHPSPTAPSSSTTAVVTSPVPRTTKATKITKSTVPSKHAAPETSPLLRQEPWVLPLLVLSAISLVTMAAFEIFVLCRARRTAPSRRHLFLGQVRPHVFRGPVMIL
jgi:hypothetical protein